MIHPTFLVHAGIVFTLSLLTILFAGYIMFVSGKMLIEYYLTRKTEVLRKLEAELGSTVSPSFQN